MKRITAILLAVVLLTASQLGAAIVDVPLEASGWTGYNSTEPVELKNGQDGSLSWNVNGFGYVYTKPAKNKSAKKPKKKLAAPSAIPSLSGATTLVFTARIVTTGDPVFGYGYGPDNPCLTPASARPILWAKGNDWYDPYARWWPRTNLLLASIPEGATVRVPMDPSNWTSVQGKGPAYSPEAMAGWLNTLANPGSVGFTLGGGCFYGHGVWATGGTAMFELVDYHFE